MSSKSHPTEAEPAQEAHQAPASFFELLFQSIFSPEFNTVPQRIMNFSFYGLFLVLSALVFLTNYNPHVIALFVLSFGLFLSVNWFLRELAKMPASSKQIQQMPSSIGASTGDIQSTQPESKKNL